MAAFVLLWSAGASAAPDAVKQTVRMFLDKANKGDFAGGIALTAQDASIIDEFAPFRWDSFADWGQAFGAYGAQNGITHARTTLLKFAHVNIEADRAYVVASVVYTYGEGGKPRKENGTEVFALEKHAAGWRIASFAWFGKAGVDQGAEASAILDTVHAFTAMTTPPAPPPSAIVDEFAPYHWTGASANAEWFAGLQKSMAKEGSSDISLALSPPDQLSVNGSKAYAVFPTIIASKMHGKRMKEHGQFAFALDKTDGAWHIASWAWATR